MAINDPVGSKYDANVCFVEVTYKGWPYVFVCARNKYVSFSRQSHLAFPKGYYM